MHNSSHARSVLNKYYIAARYTICHDAKIKPAKLKAALKSLHISRYYHSTKRTGVVILSGSALCATDWYSSTVVSAIIQALLDSYEPGVITYSRHASPPLLPTCTPLTAHVSTQYQQRAAQRGSLLTTSALTHSLCKSSVAKTWPCRHPISCSHVTHNIQASFRYSCCDVVGAIRAVCVQQLVSCT